MSDVARFSDIAKVHDIEWYAEVPRSIWKQTAAGVFLLTFVFGGFGVWAATAPLAAAVISQGSFVATGQNKLVQHFEGGIIKDLLVAEGDQVTEGQPLVRLDETAALARERELFLRQARLETIAARLDGQVRGDKAMVVPAMLIEYQDDPEVREILDSQKLNFEAQRSKLINELGLIEQNIASLRYRTEGFDRQREAMQEQLRLLREEHAGKKILFKQGLMRATEMKGIERAMADAEGQIGRLMAESAEIGAQIVKNQRQISQTEIGYRETALTELQAIEGDLDAVREQSREAANVLRRATINAPVSGTVVRTYYHTLGGVIESGKAIMEILPSNVPLMIETQVPRMEIDSVRVGQKATVRLSALNQRTTPVLYGEVFYVSADSLSGDQSAGRQEVYLARVSLPPSELARVKGFSPTPGMPAEILIQTAERTFFSYLIKPVTDSMSRAFSER